MLGKAAGGGFSVFGRDLAPPDARSLARMHLREIGKRIDATLNDKERALDDTTRAHLEECQERIAKVLGARCRWRAVTVFVQQAPSGRPLNLPGAGCCADHGAE